MDLESVNCGELVRIMWTKSSGVSSGYNHFVPLVKKVSTFHAADVNLSEVEKIRAPLKTEIDLTREDSNDVSVEEGDVWSNNESSKKENKSYLCTSCHMVFENRKYLALFNESDYNFESDEVRKVLCKDIRLCSSNGKEYLCRTCRQYLKNQKKKRYQESVCLQREKSKSISVVLVTKYLRVVMKWYWLQRRSIILNVMW